MPTTGTRRAARGLKRLAAAVAIAGLAAVPAAFAQDADEVVARVNGKDITQAEVDVAGEMFADQLAQVPEDQRRQVLVDALIDMHLVAGAARAEGMADTDRQRRRVEFLENQALRTVFIEEKVQNAVTDEVLRERYQKDVAGYTPPEEVKAAHILVETEEEAKAVLDELAKGADFAKLASEKSLDPGSKDNGGDLGYFTKGQMVPEFEAEAFALAPGEVSKAPVKTQFGFHILKVEDKRSQPVPSFEDVREQILPVVQREMFQKVMADLRAGAEVERLLPEPAADEPAADADEAEETDDAAGDEVLEPAPAQ